MARKSLRRLLAVGSSLALTLGLAGAGITTTASAADKTSQVEKKRVDRVKTPKLDWFECAGAGFECATVKVPRDYDQPKGAQVELALTRAKATDQKRKIGSLFVNPGGPGGSAADFVIFADFWASPELRSRFDIVGMDPRGVGYSDNVQCFPNFRAQVEAYNKLPDVAYPVTPAQDKAFVGWAKTLAKGCSSIGKPLSASMSTAEVARDMDVMRRAVGDKKLNYLGFSYGSYLGTVYANMFPDRFRTLAIDGVLDPSAWVGTKANRNLYTIDREKSAESGYRALREILLRCDRAGGVFCPFATGDPVKNFDLVTERLKKKPLTFVDPEFGDEVTITYQDVISFAFSALYDPAGGDYIASTMAQLLVLTEPPAAAARAQQKSAAVRTLVSNLAKVKSPKHTPKPFGFPYYDGDDAFFTVQCTDSAVGPASADAYTAYANAAEKRVKYFGRLLASQGVVCSTNTWTAHDEDAYRGPFTRTTAAPVLIVGGYWDPITNYDNAVRLSKTLPNSRLLANDSWGHTSYSTSECATKAMDTYLVSAKLPPTGTVCKGSYQPFTGDQEEEGATVIARVAAAQAQKGSPLARR